MSNTYIKGAAGDTWQFQGPVTGTSFTVTPTTSAIDFSGVLPGTETNGSVMTTKSTWVPFGVTAGMTGIKFLFASSATTGDFASLRLRARADTTGVNSQGAVICGNFSASSNTGNNNHGNLFAVQGYAQPNACTNNDGANIVCGLYSCIDASGVSSGRRWSTWVDDHSTTLASGGHSLMRLSENGASIPKIDSIFSIYQGGNGATALFNFELDSVSPIGDAVVAASGSDKSIEVTISGTPYYIPLYNSLST